jgi:hypothetical protein
VKKARLPNLRLSGPPMNKVLALVADAPLRSGPRAAAQLRR